MQCSCLSKSVVVTKKFGQLKGNAARKRTAKPFSMLAAATAAALVSALTPTPRASAATETWSGATSAFWNLNTNWTGTNLPPISGDALIFAAAGTSGTTLTDDLTTGAAFNIAGITFNASAPAYIINPASASNGFSLTGNITNNSTAKETINDAFTVSAARTLSAANGNLVFGGNITGGTGSLTLATTGANTITLTGTDTFSAANAILATGNVFSSGNISSSNTVQVIGGGTTTITGGTFNVSSTVASATLTAIGVTTGGTLVVSGGTFEQSGTGGTFSVANSGNAAGTVTVSGTGIIKIDTGNLIHLRNTTNVSGNGTTAVVNLGIGAGLGGEFDTAVTFGSVGTKGTNTINFNGAVLKLTDNVTDLFTATTLTVNDKSGGAIVDVNGFATKISAPIVNFGGTSTGGLAVNSTAGGGTLTLSAANTFAGNTVVNGGTLNLANSLALQNTTLTSGGVTFDPAVASHAFTIGNINGAVPISLQDTASNAVALTVGGGGGNTASSGALTGSGSLIKTGAGTLTLSGSSNYTGTTTLSGGGLKVTGSLGNTAVTVGTGTILSGSGDNATTGIIGGNVAVNGGGTIAIAGPSSQAFVVGGLTLGNSGAYDAADYGMLNFTASGSTVSPINIGTPGHSTGVLSLNSSGAYIPVAGFINLGTYTLLNYGSESLGGAFSLDPTTPNVTTETIGTTTYKLNDSGTALTLTVTGQVVPPVAYFTASHSSAWNDTSTPSSVNFSSNLAGTTNTMVLPGAVSDVILTASSLSGAVSSTLGGSTIINSLTVNGSASSNTLAADGSTLTLIAAGDGNTATDGSYTGNPANAGISINSNAGAFTINVPISLGSAGSLNQVWTNASANTFTVGGGVSNGGISARALTITNTGTGSTVFTAPIVDGSGTLSLAVNSTGAGATVLTAANTYTGGTTVTAGTLQLGDGTSGHDGTIVGNITNNGVVAFNRAASSTYSGVVSGTGAVSIAGTGTQTFTGVNTYSGTTTIASGGTLQLGDGTAGHDGTIKNSLSVVDNGSLVYDRQASSTYPGVISGTGTVSVIGTSTQILTGQSTYTGTTTISSGTLQLGDGTTGHDGSLASPSIVIGGSTALLAFNTFGTVAYGGVISGTNTTATALSKTGPGTLILSGTNTYDAQGQIVGGTLVMANPSALGQPAGVQYTLMSGGGILDIKTAGGGIDRAYNIALNSGAVGTILSDLDVAGNTAAHTFGTLLMSTNAFLTVAAGANVNPGGSANLTFTTLNLSGNQAGTLNSTLNPTTSSLTIGSVGTINASAFTPTKVLILDGTSVGNLISGPITSTVAGTTVALTKSNASNWDLAGASTYSGNTSINGGILSIDPTGSITSVNVSTAANAIFNANGTTNAGLSSSTILTNAGTTNIAANVGSTGVTAVTVASISMATNSSLNMVDPGLNNNANRKVLVTGALTFAGTTDAWGGKVDLAQNDLVVRNGDLGVITNQVKQAYTGGTFAGPAGITSSTLAASLDTLHTLGVANNLTSGTYDGQTLGASDVFVKYTYYGDADLSGAVTGNDYTMIDNGFSSQTSASPLTGWQNGDFNYDGKIDGSDYSLIDNAFNRQGAAIAAGPASMVASSSSEISSSTAVPEPTTLGFLGIAGLGMFGKRRRRN